MEFLIKTKETTEIVFSLEHDEPIISTEFHDKNTGVGKGSHEVKTARVCGVERPVFFGQFVAIFGHINGAQPNGQTRLVRHPVFARVFWEHQNVL